MMVCGKYNVPEKCSLGLILNKLYTIHDIEHSILMTLLQIKHRWPKLSMWLLCNKHLLEWDINLRPKYTYI